MKMSDVFNLPLKVDGGTVYDLRSSVWLGNPSVENNYCFGIQNNKASELEKDSAALIIAECVNQHDKLVELNKELVEALNSMSNLNCKLIRDYNGRNPPWRQMDEEHLHDSHMLISKAKELER